MENSARCVLPVRSVSKCRSSRSTSHGCGVSLPAACFFPSCWKAIANSYSRSSRASSTRGAWLVGPDEHAGKEVRQRRMVLPIGDEAAQQVGPAQQRAVGRRRAAERDVIAAAGARMPAVEHEFLGAEPCLPRFLVQRFGRRHQLAPRGRRMDIHLDHAGIGRDVQHLHARIAWRRIALRSPPASQGCAPYPRSAPAAPHMLRAAHMAA